MNPNPYKSTNGAHYLKALFYEEALELDKAHVLYTLKNADHTVNGKTYPSIHRLYMECDDPTEYTFATKYFDSWKHWKMIRDTAWMKPVYLEMKEELELRIRSTAVVALREAASNAKDAVQVNKYLIEKGYSDKDDKRGRPSKEAIKREADKMTKDHDLISDDYGRIVSIADRK